MGRATGLHHDGSSDPESALKDAPAAIVFTRAVRQPLVSSLGHRRRTGDQADIDCLRRPQAAPAPVAIVESSELQCLFCPAAWFSHPGTGRSKPSTTECSAAPGRSSVMSPAATRQDGPLHVRPLHRSPRARSVCEPAHSCPKAIPFPFDEPPLLCPRQIARPENIGERRRPVLTRESGAQKAAVEVADCD